MRARSEMGGDYARARCGYARAAGDVCAEMIRASPVPAAAEGTVVATHHCQ